MQRKKRAKRGTHLGKEARLGPGRCTCSLTYASASSRPECREEGLGLTGEQTQTGTTSLQPGLHSDEDPTGTTLSSPCQADFPAAMGLGKTGWVRSKEEGTRPVALKRRMMKPLVLDTSSRAGGGRASQDLSPAQSSPNPPLTLP